MGGVEMYGNISSLPIELIHFKATLQGAVVLLQWQTATEINNAYFTVERSANGQDFEEVAFVDGKGNSRSLTTYQVVDQQPLGGVSYYRLRQTDRDAQSTHSKIVALHNIRDDASDFSLYPNPLDANTKLTIAASNLEEEEVRITIQDLIGQQQYNRVITCLATQKPFWWKRIT